MKTLVITTAQFNFLETEFGDFNANISSEEILENHYQEKDENQNIDDYVEEFILIEEEIEHEVFDRKIQYRLTGGGLCSNGYTWENMDLSQIEEALKLQDAIENGDIVVNENGDHFLYGESKNCFYIGTDRNWKRDWLNEDGSPQEGIETGEYWLPTEHSGFDYFPAVWQKNKDVTGPSVFSDFEWNGSQYIIMDAFSV